MRFTESRARLWLKIGQIEDFVDVQVVKTDDHRFAYDLLLGLDAITKFKLIQDEKLNIHQRVGEHEPLPITQRKTETGPEDIQNELTVNFNEYLNVDQFEANLQHLDANKKTAISELIGRFEDIFARNKFDVGRVKNHEAQIQMTEYRYVAKKPYRCAIPDQKEIEGQVAELLNAGLIEDSCSPFAAPVSLAYKKNAKGGREKSRMVVDLRELNKLIVPEPQPFPRIDDITVLAGSCSWWSSFDINSAFWAIPIRFRDRKKLGFVTQRGHYQWKVLPFGLKTSPAIFQRILSGIIRRNGLGDFCINFIDDILVFSKSFEEHLRHIELLMKAIKKEGFRLKLVKCDFAKRRIKYLGHIIEKGKVRPARDNLAAIRDFPTPRTRTNVRQLLGKINFYRQFIDNVSNRLAPLHDLLKSKTNNRFEWTTACENAFQYVKNRLCTDPVLAIYDPNKPVYIYTDGSGCGLGAVLKQPQESGVLHPVAYFSKKVTAGQMKKKAIYLELLAMKEAVTFWQFWLIGRTFTVVSDHKPLEQLRLSARTDEALGDLALYLSQFDFKIIYSPGKTNVEADSLSRNPVLVSFEGEDEEVMPVANLVELKAIIEDQTAHSEELKQETATIKKNSIVMKRLRNRQRIWMSKKFAQDLIRKVHGRYGHVGTWHIAKKIRPFYYRRNLDRLIQEFCERCETCIKNKSRTKRKIGLLSKLGPASKPFEIMSIDTVGGFAGNRSTHRYMHILADHFTRKAFISTSKGQSADDFVRLLEPIAKKQKIGLVLTDQYTGLNSKKLKNYLNGNNVPLIFTSIDHAESNGLNERLNQTLVNRIRCKLAESPKRAWTVIAHECVREYNQTTHSSTGFAPEYLASGEESHIVPPEFIVPRDLERDRAQALLNSTRSFEKNKERVDKNRREHEFKENDLVYARIGSRLGKNKLDEWRSGPFRVIGKISNSIYELDTGRRRKESNFFHSNLLLPTATEQPQNSGLVRHPGGGEV